MIQIKPISVGIQIYKLGFPNLLHGDFIVASYSMLPNHILCFQFSILRNSEEPNEISKHRGAATKLL